MPLKLIYTAETTVPVEIEGFTPRAVSGASLDDVRRFGIFHGNRKTPLGEMFQVEGDTHDLQWHLHGDLSGVHWIGAHMEAGSIHVNGSAGRHLGSEMRGGSITVNGDAGDWLGGQMRGGTIRVAGRAGQIVGGAYCGSSQGMTGGVIVIQGDAGDGVGRSMRRGWIAVGGHCGDMIGGNLQGGSLFVLGRCGMRPGAGMRRGTIGVFGTPKPELLPTFRLACRQRPIVLRLVARRLAELGLPIDGTVAGEVDIFSGDLLEGGRGEIWLRG